MSWRLRKQDVSASLVVLLVALPLCMGVAIASGMPPSAGLITVLPRKRAFAHWRVPSARRPTVTWEDTWFAQYKPNEPCAQHPQLHPIRGQRLIF
jgi:Sulfate permease family